MSTSIDQTIAALSTPTGQSGIAVVRLSGTDALDILSRIFRPVSGGGASPEWEHRRLYHGHVLAPDGRLMLEFGDGQEESARAAFGPPAWQIETTESDLTDRPRILIARRI